MQNMPCIVELKIVPKAEHEAEPLFRASGKTEQ
jgi:hypothetical protein